jgi:hypothetical protein
MPGHGPLGFVEFQKFSPSPGVQRRIRQHHTHKHAVVEHKGMGTVWLESWHKRLLCRDLRRARERRTGPVRARAGHGPPLSVPTGGRANFHAEESKPRGAIR